MSLPDILPRASTVDSTSSGNLTQSSIVLSDEMGVNGNNDASDNVSDESVTYRDSHMTPDLIIRPPVHPTAFRRS